MVITPLTERAFLAIGHALKTFHCATMIGPNGTGKTETIRELAKVSTAKWILFEGILKLSIEYMMVYVFFSCFLTT